MTGDECPHDFGSFFVQGDSLVCGNCGALIYDDGASTEGKQAMNDDRAAVALTLARRLIDTEQGVCPEGHDCYLVTTPRGTFERSCAVQHDLGDRIEWWYGQPLIAEDVTAGAIDAAETAGADNALIAWARATLADR